MATEVEQLTKIIEGVAQGGALTPQAIRQFDEMVTRVQNLELRLAAAEKDAVEQNTLYRDTLASQSLMCWKIPARRIASSARKSMKR